MNNISSRYLLSQDNQQPPEDTNEVNEQLKGVLHKVLAAHSALLDDQLSIEQYKSTHQHKSQVQVGLQQEYFA